MNSNIDWLGINNANLYGFHGRHHNGVAAVNYYNSKVTDRRERYSFELTTEAIESGKTTKDRGYNKVENFFSDAQKATLLESKEWINKLVNENKHIKKRDQNMAFINQPILNIPNLYKIMFDEKIIDIVTAYFDCVPALTSVAVRKSFTSDAAPVNNQLFHRDYNSLVKLLKIVIYLNDVDINGGPFTYIEDSHKKIFNNWWHYHYIQDEVMKTIYGEDKIKHLTANFGDLLMADTRGFHKGLKPKTSERYAMHMCFLIHPELTGPGHQQETPPDKGFQIRKEDYESLPDNVKPVADYLVKI